MSGILRYWWVPNTDLFSLDSKCMIMVMVILTRKIGNYVLILWLELIMWPHFPGCERVFWSGISCVKIAENMPYPALVLRAFYLLTLNNICSFGDIHDAGLASRGVHCRHHILCIHDNYAGMIFYKSKDVVLIWNVVQIWDGKMLCRDKICCTAHNELHRDKMLCRNMMLFMLCL